METVTVKTIDFSRSFCTWLLKGQASHGRFSVEAVLRVPGSGEEFLSLSGVMAANVYGDGPLIIRPAYEFAAVFGGSNYRVFRTHAVYQPEKDTCHAISEQFESVHRQMSTCMGQKVSTPAQITEATLKGQPLTAHVQFTHCELIFPVKHINVQTQRQAFQVETGPVLLPADFRNISVQTLKQAFIGFNRLDEAEFAIRDAVPLGTQHVRHYENVEKHQAAIQLTVLHSD